MQQLALVSVIIPTYNRARFIGAALRSVLEQSFQDVELIVVDDGSTDDTRRVVESFGSERVRYVYQENRGRSNARNRALALARGEMIAFLDSDDEFLPGKLERQVRILGDEPDVGWVYGSARVVDEAGNELLAYDKEGNPKVYYEATESGWIYDKVAFYLPVTVILPTVMIRRGVVERVGTFDERLHRFEDTDYWRRTSKVAQAFAVQEPLCKITAHSGNRMEDPRKLYRWVSCYAKKIQREDRDRPAAVRRRGLGNLYLRYASAVYCSSEYPKALSVPFFVKVVRYVPVQFGLQALRIAYRPFKAVAPWRRRRERETE